jgi:VanZ family protein
VAKPRSPIAPWIPVLLWIGVITVLGSGEFQAEQTSRILVPLLRWLFPDWGPERIAAAHRVLRELAHPVEYAIAALLTWRALAQSLRAPGGLRLAVFSLGLLLLVACADELRQGVLDSRTGSVADVATDLLGGLAGVLAAPFVVRGRPPEAADG